MPAPPDESDTMEHFRCIAWTSWSHAPSIVYGDKYDSTPIRTRQLCHGSAGPSTCLPADTDKIRTLAVRRAFHTAGVPRLP